MSEPIIEIADGLVAKLNAGPFDPALGAERVYRRLLDLPQLSQRKVTVLPAQDSSPERLSRKTWRHELVVQILVQKKLQTEELAEQDALVNLAGEIRQWLKDPANRPDRPERLIGLDVVSLWNPELLETKKIFTSVVNLIYFGER